MAIESAGSNDYEASVVLVHGTWPRGPFRSPVPPNTSHHALWYEGDSKFCDAISAILGTRPQFETFIWSGKNSLDARYNAAYMLAERLEALAIERPSHKRFVIAHSHGGNVALASAAMLPLSARPHGIATMATPFLYFRERVLTDFQQNTYPVGAMVFFYVVGIAVTTAFLYPILAAISLLYPISNKLEIAMGIGALFIILLSYLLHNYALIVWLRWWDRAEHLLQTISPANLPCDILITRVQADEASAALGLGVLAPQLVRVVRDLTVHARWFRTTVSALSALAGSVFITFSEYVFLPGLGICFTGRIVGWTTVDRWCSTAISALTEPPVANYLVGFIAFLVVVSLLMFLFFLLESLTTAFFGFDSVLYGLGFIISAESKPRRGNSPYRIEEPDIFLSSEREGIAHSMYKIPHVAEQIAVWMRGFTNEQRPAL